jgi:hypothetical protein
MTGDRDDRAPNPSIRASLRDSAAAVTRAARSLKASARQSARAAKSNAVQMKNRAKVRVAITEAAIKQKAQAATTRVREAKSQIKARVARAWDALAHDSATECAPSSATPRKAATRRPAGLGRSHVAEITVTPGREAVPARARFRAAGIQ